MYDARVFPHTRVGCHYRPGKRQNQKHLGVNLSHFRSGSASRAGIRILLRKVRDQIRVTILREGMRYGLAKKNNLLKFVSFVQTC